MVTAINDDVVKPIAHGARYVKRHAGGFARGALNNRLVRGIATGVAIGALCSSGFGCALAVGMIAGGTLGALNGQINKKRAGVWGSAGLGMIDGMKISATRLLLGQAFSPTGGNLGWLGAANSGAGRLMIDLVRGLFK